MRAILFSILGYVVILPIPLSGPAHAYRCGPFDWWESGTYCVNCSGGKNVFRYEQCPGGETGLATVAFIFGGCSVSYDYSACPISSHLRSREDFSTLLKSLEAERTYDPKKLEQK